MAGNNVDSAGHYYESQRQLENRLDKNLADFDAQMMGLDKRDLIDKAWEIAAMHDTYEYLTMYYCFEADQIDYLLLFQNPLKIVSDAWGEQHGNLRDMANTLDDIFDTHAAIELGYDLMTEPEIRIPGKHRFMNVDLIDFLGKITEKVVINSPGDWFIDKQALYKFAGSKIPEDKKLMFGISIAGTHLFTEHDTFVKGIGGYMYWTAYEPDIPDLFGFMVEIAGFDGMAIRGNVYDMGDYAEHADFVRNSAIPVEGVTVTFDNGAVHKMNLDNYDLNRKSLADENGTVIDTRFYSADDGALYTLLSHEEVLRGSFPAHNTEAYLLELTDYIDTRRSERAAEQAKKIPAETAVKDKASIGDKLRAAQEKVNAQAAKHKAPSHSAIIRLSADDR